jgi:hypothetical protein
VQVLRRAVALAAAILLLTAQAVWADNLDVDGDGLAPIANNALAFGTVCAESTTTKGALLAIHRTGSTHYANGATIVVSVGSVTGAGLTAATPPAISLASNWNSLPNGTTLSSPVTGNVTLVAGGPGPLSGSVSYSATGPRAGGGILVESRTLSVTATVVNCDTTPPTLSLPADPVVEATGPSGAPVSYVATASDLNPASPVVTCSPASGAVFALGATTVDCSATDAAGNVANGSFTVTVVDTTGPSISGTPADVTAEAAGPGGAIVTYAQPTASDLVDGVVGVACDPASGSTFAIGATLVTCSATDAAGNTGEQAFNVLVQDTTSPVLGLPADLIAEATGPTGAEVAFSASASDLVDGSLAVTCVPASGSAFPLGATTVDCSAVDAAGNVASGSFTVTVVDTTPPAVSVPASFSVEATGPSGADVSFSSSAVDLVDGAVSPTCTPSSGTTFPLGPTTVECSATDAAGNTGSAAFVVTVVDTTPPDLSLPPNVVLEATGSAGAVHSFTASAADLVDVSVDVACSPASGSTFPLGTTTVDCTATDDAGNASMGSFSVEVVDTTPPDVAVPADMTVEATGASGATVTFVASATDLVDGAVSTACSPASGAVFAVDVPTIVTCSATDAHGNTGSASFVVMVVDTTPPDVTAPAPVTVEGNTLGGASVGAGGPTGAALASFLGGAGASDLVDPDPVIGHDAPALFPLGSTVVTFTGTDDHGNAASAGSSVTVVDTTAPLISGVPGSVVKGTLDPSGAIVTYVAPSAADIVDGALPVACLPASGAKFAVGTTTVACSVSDASGNTASASFTVTVDLYAAAFKAPIDGPSVLNVAKAGRVIPVKVEVSKNGVENRTGPVTILVNKLASCTSATEDSLETYAAAGSSNTGNLFRWDAAADAWIYNLDTSAPGMATGSCYRGNVYLDGNLTGFFLVKLMK